VSPWKRSVGILSKLPFRSQWTNGKERLLGSAGNEGNFLKKGALDADSHFVWAGEQEKVKRARNVPRLEGGKDSKEIERRDKKRMRFKKRAGSQRLV